MVVDEDVVLLSLGQVHCCRCQCFFVVVVPVRPPCCLLVHNFHGVIEFEVALVVKENCVPCRMKNIEAYARHLIKLNQRR